MFGAPKVSEWWRDSALCAQVGGDLWFPEKGGPSGAAKQICAVCPVREACLEYALENDITAGIWGNTTPLERRTLKRAAA